MVEQKQTNIEKPSPFYLGGLATMMAAVISNPFEVVKVRMQLQGELQQRGSYKMAYNNSFQALYAIGRNEGLASLQKGLVAALGYQAVMNGTRLELYKRINEATSKVLPDQPVLCRVLAGASAGMTGAFMGSPFFLAKTRMQAQSDIVKIGTQHNYTSTLDCYRHILRERGVAGLFTGVTSGMLRVGVGSAVQLSSYDTCKNFVFASGLIAEESVLLHMGSAMTASILLVFAMNPFDVISTRLYNQPMKNGVGTMYKNISDCAIKLLGTEGVTCFYKGTLAHYLRIGPHTVMTFIFWEKLKHLHRTYCGE